MILGILVMVPEFHGSCNPVPSSYKKGNREPKIQGKIGSSVSLWRES